MARQPGKGLLDRGGQRSVAVRREELTDIPGILRPSREQFEQDEIDGPDDGDNHVENGERLGAPNGLPLPPRTADDDIHRAFPLLPDPHDARKGVLDVATPDLGDRPS